MIFAPNINSLLPLDEQLDLYEAAEIRDANGSRRFGTVFTIRRRLKDGSLPHQMRGNKYVVRRADLEVLKLTDSQDRAEAALAELEIAANRVLATSGPLSDETCERIAARLTGGGES